jgi:peptidoglycan/LPS O-acetylase OafA/YrhL
MRHYVPALDGVRGLAILAVMLCHFTWYAQAPDRVTQLGIEALRAGRYGVDLFFVLSGYLITGILYDAKGERHYFRNFYARRVLRIFPLYYSVLFAMFVLGPLVVRWNQPGESRVVGAQGWLWLYLSNIKTAVAGPELFEQGRLWVGHFWSLAVEEQFYLVWPLVILLLSRADAMRLCLAMIVAAPVLRALLMVTLPYPDGLYHAVYLTPCKLDALGLGALLALAARGPGGLRRYAPFAKPTVIVALVALAPLLVIKPDKSGGPGAVVETIKFSLIVLACGSLVVLATHGRSRRLDCALTRPLLRALGKYSYGIYVLHNLFTPLFEGRLSTVRISGRLGVSWHAAFALHVMAGSAISIGTALLSWNLLEKHALKLKQLFDRPRNEDRFASPVALYRPA